MIDPLVNQCSKSSWYQKSNSTSHNNSAPNNNSRSKVIRLLMVIPILKVFEQLIVIRDQSSNWTSNKNSRST